MKYTREEIIIIVGGLLQWWQQEKEEEVVLETPSGKDLGDALFKIRRSVCEMLTVNMAMMTELHAVINCVWSLRESKYMLL